MTEPRQTEPGSPLDFHVARELDMRVAPSEPGRSVMTGAAGEHHLNPHGTVHGATIFALVDTSMGAATMSVVDEGKICASIEVHLRFLRPVAPGPLRVDTRVVHPGKRVVQLESEVRDGGDRLVATATGSFAVIEPKAS